MTYPLVNIMMPVYNGMPLIEASVKSVLAQNYPNWHCIICDDGSTDGTWQYLQTLTDDSRFTLLHNDENMGRGISRQRILEASTGKYVCMLDSGDMMHPNRITLQVEFLESHPEVGIVSSGMLSFGTHTDLLRIRGEGNDKINSFSGDGSVCFAPSMFRTDITRDNEITFGTMMFSEDTYFLSQYYKANPLYYSIPQPLYYYSEFDGQRKKDLLVSYLQLVRLYSHPFVPRQVILNLLKIIYTAFTYPFISMEKRVANRGREVTPEEREEFLSNK